MKKLMSAILLIIFVLTLCGCRSEPQEQISYLSYNEAEVITAEDTSSINNEPIIKKKEIKQVSSDNEIQSKPQAPGEISSAVSPYYEDSGTTSSRRDNSGTASRDKSKELSGTVIARISSEKVKMLPSGLSYRMIVDALGKSSSAGHWTGYYEYVVDDDNLLMLYFDDPSDICNLSGEQLLETLVPLKSHLNDPQNSTAYAIAVDEWVTVSSPNYKAFGCARLKTKDAKISFADGTPATEDDIKRGQALIIKHEKWILSTYPAQVYATEIVIQ